jgi:quercetin dioxygenase-like cupin family protein
MNKPLILLAFISSCLYSCSKPSAKNIEVITLMETTKSWDSTYLPAYLDGKPKITILKFIIPPKTRLMPHKHLEINAGVLLKGKLRVISQNNDTLHLNAGDPIAELVDIWHYGENEGSEPAEIIVFYAGVEGTPITILKDKDKKE